MRLTTRTEDGRAIIKLHTEPTDIKGVIDESAQKNREVVEKLARYEDLEEIDPETGLRPCPMCGGAGKLINYFPEGITWVFCRECRLSSRSATTQEEAIAAWNRRAGE